MSSLVLAVAILVQAAKPEDAAAAEAIEKFKTDYKAKETSARAAAVADLAQTQHDKVYIHLAQVLTSGDEKEVRIAAAKGLGGATEKKKPVALLSASLGPNAKDVAVVAAILEALGRLGDQSACPTVENNFKSKSVTVLKAAVEAAGDLKSRGSVRPLIDLLKNLEEGAKQAPTMTGGSYGGGNIPQVNGGGVSDDLAKERERVVKPIVIKVLGNLTKVNHTLAKEWEDWWRAEGGKFMSGK
jgi:HEAT repeat protein